MKHIYANIKNELKSIWRKTRIFWVGLLLLVLVFVVIYGVPKLYFSFLEPTASFSSDKERIETEDQLRRTVLQILGGVVVVIGLYLTYRRIKASEEQVRTQGQQVEAFRKQVAVTEDSQITERFTRAVEQLASESIHIRLGGIYALERVANDSDRDHATIMEILAAFVRERGPVQQTDDVISSDRDANKLIDLEEDIYAVLSVLGRRKIIEGEVPPNLDNTNFRRAKLHRINLPGISLFGVNFSGADLWGANLERALLVAADFRKAKLSLADLRKANLLGADLLRTNLQGAQFQQADLHLANLRWADLWLTNLQQARNITAEQLAHAKTLYEAKLDPELEKELREKHPHLFEEPKKDQEDDEEKDYDETE